MKFLGNAVFAVAGIVMLSGCAAGSAGASSSPAPASKTEEIEHWLLQSYGDLGWLQYALAWSDLDADGSDEAVIYVAGPSMCGTGGCNTVVLTRAGPGWRQVGDVSVSRTPVTVLNSRTNGWSDLTVDFAGGGGPSGTARLPFDGTNYPDNATVPPAVPTSSKGRVLIAADPAFKRLDPVD